MKAILAAIDFSRGTDLVVSAAASLARALDAKVVLLTVLVEPVFVKEYAPAPRQVAPITLAHEGTVRRQLVALEEQLRCEGVAVETVVHRGAPPRHIVDEAEDQGAAFIVIGSHGHGALFELVVGSTTQFVLRHARQPVVVIPVNATRRRRAAAKSRAVGSPP